MSSKIKGSKFSFPVVLGYVFGISGINRFGKERVECTKLELNLKFYWPLPTVPTLISEVGLIINSIYQLVSGFCWENHQSLDKFCCYSFRPWLSVAHMKRSLVSNCYCRSVSKSCLTLHNPIDCRMPGFLVLHYFLEFAQTEVHWTVWLYNYLILCHALLLLPSSFPNIRIFSTESALCIRWPKCWSFSFSITPSKDYSGLISFKIDWFDLLAVQGSLKSLLLRTTVIKHQFFNTQPSLWSNFQIYTWLLEKPQLWLHGLLTKWCLCFLMCYVCFS